VERDGSARDGDFLSNEKQKGAPSRFKREFGLTERLCYIVLVCRKLARNAVDQKKLTQQFAGLHAPAKAENLSVATATASRRHILEVNLPLEL